MGRKVSAILSRGLFNISQSTSLTSTDLLSLDAQWVLLVKTVVRTDSAKIQIGVALFDLQSLQVRLGQFEEESNLSTLRTIMSHDKPVTVVYDRADMPKDILKCLKTFAVD